MNDIPMLLWIAFFSGQLLTADDLNALESNAQQLRWLHNRTMHDWGIAYGLGVQGKRGATFVTVSPGIAVDSFGREILLSASIQKPIPSVPGAAGGSVYYLVANYVDDSDATVVEQRSATACGTGGAVRLSNDPSIVWKTSAQLDIGNDVVLGQVSVQNCVMSADVSAAARRSVSYDAKFAVTAGAVSGKDVQWTAMNTSGKNTGFKAKIDTSSANFSSTPAYTAQIVGTRALSGSEGTIVDFVTVSEATAGAFTLQIALPDLGQDINPSRITDATDGPKLMVELGWEVSWFAVEG